MSSRTCTDARRKILIIGGGAFGLSSAWHLKGGRNDVTICDHFEGVAPSRDVSKIIRIDYPDPERIKEAMRSKSLWECDPVFKPFYIRTGRVVAYPEAQIQTLIEIERARLRLGLPARKRESSQLRNGLFSSTHFPENMVVVHNKDDGVVDWTGVMNSVKEDCLKNGVVFQQDEVLRIESDTSGRVKSVVTSTGSIDTKETEVILAAGPWIMQLLETSSMRAPPTSRAPIATGIFSFSLELNIEQWTKYKDLPVNSEIGVGT